jgi:hypothetical protein
MKKAPGVGVYGKRVFSPQLPPSNPAVARYMIADFARGCGKNLFHTTDTKKARRQIAELLRATFVAFV